MNVPVTPKNQKAFSKWLNTRTAPFFLAAALFLCTVLTVLTLTLSCTPEYGCNLKKPVADAAEYGFRSEQTTFAAAYPVTEETAFTAAYSIAEQSAHIADDAERDGLSVDFIIRIDGTEAARKKYRLNPKVTDYMHRLSLSRPSQVFDTLLTLELSPGDAVTFLLPEAKADIEALLLAREHPVIDAEMFFDASKIPCFTYVDGSDGARFDRDKIYKAIAAAVDRPQSVIIIRSEKIRAVKVGELKRKTAKISLFSTNYTASADARKSNIALAASFINGTVVPPGGEFSFNAVVGKRTAERGFRDAPIILDGKFTEGVGGGVCQVSTTVYNAGLLAGLNAMSVARHTLPVRYVPPSFDAMVSSATDLKMRNDSDDNIYITARADGSSLTVTMYGKRPEFEIRTRSVTLKTTPHETEYVLNPELLSDESVIAKGADGLESEGYIEYLKNGEIISVKKIRRDVYAPQKRIVEVKELPPPE
ncbi:MAG: VanW family protein [Clostridiaceae bacterium]|jgi:vancomycin resistance protein YoaR|nr:VanW family protein [Clostridiaceae bacterium]